MAKKDDAALMASMSSRRDPVKLARDMEETPFAHLAAQVKEQTMIAIASIFVSPFQSRVDAQATVSEDEDDYLTRLGKLLTPAQWKQLRHDD